MNRKENFNSFQFHHQTVLHDEVKAEAGVNPNSVISDRQHDLPFHLQASFGQLVYETHLVHALQESRPQCMVNCIRRVHHLTGDMI